MEPAAKKAKTDGTPVVMLMLDDGTEVPLAAESPVLKMSEMLTTMVSRWSEEEKVSNNVISITGCSKTAVLALMRVCHNRTTTAPALAAPTVDLFTKKWAWGLTPEEKEADEQAEAVNKVQVQAVKDWQDEQDAADVKGIEAFFEEEPAATALGGETSLEVLGMALTAANFLVVDGAVVDVLCKIIAVAIAPEMKNKKNTYLKVVQTTLSGGPPPPALVVGADESTAPTLAEVDMHLRVIHSIEPSLLGKILRFVGDSEEEESSSTGGGGGSGRAGRTELRGSALPKQFWALYHGGHKAAKATEAAELQAARAEAEREAEEARQAAEKQAIHDDPYGDQEWDHEFLFDASTKGAGDDASSGSYTLKYTMHGQTTMEKTSRKSNFNYDGNIRFQVFCNADEGKDVELKSEKVDVDDYISGSSSEFHEEFQGPADHMSTNWGELGLEEVMLRTNQQIEDIKAGEGMGTKGIGITINESAQRYIEGEIQTAMTKYLGSWDNVVEG